MNDPRPDPDALLRRVQEEERKKTRGRLTVFFGAAPGVGKTYAMLMEAGREQDIEGRDVVAGVVETHGRFETTTLLAGFERLPMRRVEYRGATLEELDLDAALARKPSLILVDELAHTNAEGSRHPKRWQDVEELRDAGIEVYTTLNVQHVESLNDVVAQITGITVRETVPDSVLDGADDVKLVDLPADDLIQRLREGKVYLPATVERALEGFFRKGNLIALRELALRRTAERVDADMLAYRRAHGIEATWGASDRLLVCISASPFSANLLRVGRRMAGSLKARWYAVNIETAATLRLGAADRARLSDNLRLAEQLGAETVTLTGESAADEILRFAREQNVSKIVAGKPRVRRLRDRFGGGFLDDLILKSRDIDIYVTVGDESAPPQAERAAGGARPPPARDPGGYAVGALATAISTGVAFALFGREHLSDVIMTYLLGVVIVATRCSFRVSLATAILSVLAFDVVFIPPFFTFSVVDLRHIVTFAVMLVVAVVIAGLTQRVKDQAEVARKSERRTAALYAMSRDLAEAHARDLVIRTACRHLEATFDGAVVVFVRNADDAEPTCVYSTPGMEAPLAKERGIVRWVWQNRHEAGLGTHTLPSGNGLYLPLIGSSAAREVVGVLGVIPKDPLRLHDPEQRRLADALGTQMAMGIERAQLAEETQRARLQVEAEQLRSTLLASVSHDLRTPLAVMKGAVTTLLADDAALSPETRRELAQTVLEETEGLERLVRNLLDMTRLESGAVELKKEWQSVEEVIGGTLSRLESRLGEHEVHAHVPPDLLAPFDPVLIEQVLVNLLENAAKYTPPGTLIDISAAQQAGAVVFEVSDRGAGLSEGEHDRVFEKFHRGRAERTKGGVGLGLTICRAIVTAHGGEISAEARPGGGATFRFTLPLEGEPPQGPLPEAEEGRADEPVAEARGNSEVRP